MYSPLSLHHAHMSIRSTPVCSFVRWFCGSCNLRLHDVQYKLGHAANRQHYNQRLFLAENSANIRHRILTVRTTFALLQPAGRIRLEQHSAELLHTHQPQCFPLYVDAFTSFEHLQADKQIITGEYLADVVSLRQDIPVSVNVCEHQIALLSLLCNPKSAFSNHQYRPNTISRPVCVWCIQYSYQTESENYSSHRHL